MRREFFEIPARERRPGRFSILVFGGSQGAHAINEAMIAALPFLKNLKDELRLTHQTGEADFAKVNARYAESIWREHATVRKYIDNMVEAFAEVDLVICRAGATTTAELNRRRQGVGNDSFPLAADDHQRKNAEALEAAGAGKMILQQDLSGERLAQEITTLVHEPEKISTMEQAARKLARGDAAAAVVEMVEKLVGNDK